MSGDDEHSRQILSYWTHERMQSAEPEPGIEFYTMSSADSAKAILDYWTPARVAAAVPEEHAYDEHTAEDFDKDVQLQGAGSMKIVPDTTVKTFPYQSVGKLFYAKVSPSGSWDSYASAWVANMTTLLHVVYTAAHNLKRGNKHAENISFIPAFIPPCTRPFGSYPQIPSGEGVAWAVDPHWNPNNLQPQYDQGIVKLAANANTRKHVDEVVIPIQISSNQQYTSFSKWNSIGFPEPTRMNPAGKMMEQSGTFNKVSNNTVLKYGTLPKGTSGGAWILANSNDSANGVQAGNRNDVGCAVSPYFHSSMEELVKFFKFMS